MRADTMRTMGGLGALACPLLGAMVSCGPGRDGECGNGALAPAEECDDANQQPGDGCGVSCLVDPGWTCSGQPSTCTPIPGPECGDGVVDASEPCDDGDLDGGDGCDGACAVEAGYTCMGEPSMCIGIGQAACDDAIDLNDAANVTVNGATTTYLGDTTGSTLMDFGTRSCATAGGIGVEAVLHRYTLNGPASLEVVLLHRYTLNGPASLEVVLQDVGGLPDSIMYGYLDCIAPVMDVFCDDDGNGLLSSATAQFQPAGTTFYIVVTGYAPGTDVGPYQLDVTEIP